MTTPRRTTTALLIAAAVSLTTPAVAGPLHDAARKGDTEEVKRLLTAGADVNVHGSNGYTPLHWAAYDGSGANVTALLTAGADVNAQDNYGNTPLILAIRRGYTETVAVQDLLDAGADINAKGNDGRTALQRAVAARPLRWRLNPTVTPFMAALIAAGADVNVPVTDAGWTLLHLAVELGRTQMVAALLKGGADPNAKTTLEGWTPHDLAATNMMNPDKVTAQARIIRLLLDAGADATEEPVAKPKHPHRDKVTF